MILRRGLGLDHRRMRDSRVHVERYVEHLSPPKDRPKPLVVEEDPVGHPVHHRSFKAEPADRAFEFVGCCLGVGSGQCRKGRKSVGVGAYRLVEAVIGAAVSASSFWSPGMYATTPAGRCRPRPFPSSAVRPDRRDAARLPARRSRQTAGVPLHFGIVVMLLQGDDVGFGSHSSSSLLNGHCGIRSTGLSAAPPAASAAGLIAAKS